MLFPVKEYLIPSRAAVGKFPTWLVNKDLVGAGQWEFIPTRLVLPRQLPATLGAGAAWEILGCPQPLLKSGVKEGIFLNLDQLKNIHEALLFPLPNPKEGSGATGNIVKEDYCRGLIEMLFPEETQEEKKRMFDAMHGRVARKVRCPREVIEAVKELGQQGEMDFKQVHQVALNQEAVEKDTEQTTREPILNRKEQETFTPPELKDLLPPGAGIYCSRNPLLRRYQGGYASPCAFSRAMKKSLLLAVYKTLCCPVLWGL